MFDEIGSEYWEADRKGTANEIMKGAVYTASGRSAQSMIVDSLETKNKVALLPGYTCQHVVEPFDWKGWKVLFYDINKDLTPDVESFKAGVSQNPGCILVESYYGFDTSKPIVDIIREAQGKGAIVIEDITHSFLNKTPLSYKDVDYIYCSLRKWTGLSDGGFVIANCGKKLPEPIAEMTTFVQERHEAREIKKEYVSKLEQPLKDSFLYHYNHSEEILDGDIGIYKMSAQAFDDYIHADWDFVKQRRQENFRYLLDNLKSEYVDPIFKVIDEMTVPIMFPVIIDKYRLEIRKTLIENRIYCPIHWPMPEQLPETEYPKSSYIYNHIMSIPCDQRYTTQDMARVVEIINNYKA